MDSGQYELQIFVSLVVVLGAAFVALICDFLKGNNEQLRELAIELKVRREEEQRREQTMIPQRMDRPRPAPAEPAVEPAPERAAIIPVARVNPPDPQPASETPAVSIAMIENPAPLRAIVTRPAPRISVAAKGMVASAPKKDWGSLISRSSPASNPRPTVVLQSHPVAMPTGFHSADALNRLAANRHTVTGLVVSVGVTTLHAAGGSLPDAVVDLVRSLIRSEEFACQSGDGEFLLICPAETGAAAQRRLSQIAQQLWDFQLTSLGKYSILFSWGGLEVRGESIAEAAAAAQERMDETRRSRKIFMMAPTKEMAFRHAV